MQGVLLLIFYTWPKLPSDIVLGILVCQMALNVVNRNQFVSIVKHSTLLKALFQTWMRNRLIFATEGEKRGHFTLVRHAKWQKTKNLVVEVAVKSLKKEFSLTYWKVRNLVWLDFHFCSMFLFKWHCMHLLTFLKTPPDLPRFLQLEPILGVRLSCGMHGDVSHISTSPCHALVFIGAPGSLPSLSPPIYLACWSHWSCYLPCQGTLVPG